MMDLWDQYHPHVKLVELDHVCEFTEISDGDVSTNRESYENHPLT